MHTTQKWETLMSTHCHMQKQVLDEWIVYKAEEQVDCFGKA